MQCRICFEEGRPTEFVSPCRCAGTIQYIHKTCLHAEQRHRREEWEQTGTLRCTICQEPYDLRCLEPRDPGCYPDIVMSSFLQLNILAFYTMSHHVLENTYLIVTIQMCLLFNLVASLGWIRYSMRYSLLQHVNIHLTSLCLLAKYQFPSFAWIHLVWFVMFVAILYYYIMFVQLILEDRMTWFPSFCLATLVILEYLLVIVAFHETADNENLSILFAAFFTNVCMWSYSATRLCIRNR